MSKAATAPKSVISRLRDRLIFCAYWSQNLGLFLWCILIYVFRGKANKTGGIPKKIIIAQTTTNLGDMVCTTPVFRAIKRAYPDARVYVLGTRKNRELLEGNTDVDAYIEHDGFFALLRQLRKEQFDFGCIPTTHFKNLALLYLAGVRHIAVPSFVQPGMRHTKAYQLLKRIAVEAPTYVGTYVPREHLRLLEPIGIHTQDSQKHLAYTPEARGSIDALFARHGVDPSHTIVAAIEVGAGQLYKQWPLQRFAAVANYITQKHGGASVLIGGPGDREAAQELLKYIDPKTRIINAVGQTIGELKALLAAVSFIIANDSGPVYIAEAFGTGTIVLVGPTNEAEHPPYGSLHRVVVPEPRGNVQMFSMLFLPINEAMALEQMNNITVQRVQETVDALVTALAQKNGAAHATVPMPTI